MPPVGRTVRGGFLDRPCDATGMILLKGSVARVTIKGQLVTIPVGATHFDPQRDMWAFANAGPASGWRLERLHEIIGIGSGPTAAFKGFGVSRVGQTRITLFLNTPEGVIPVDPEGRKHFANSDRNNVSLTLDDRMMQSLISPTSPMCVPARLFCKDVYEVQWHVWHRRDLKRAWRAVHADSRRAANGRLGYKHVFALLAKIKAAPESYDPPLRCLVLLHDIMARNLEGIHPLLALQADGSKSKSRAVIDDEDGMLFRAGSRANTGLAIGNVEVSADKDCEFGEFDYLSLLRHTNDNRQRQHAAPRLRSPALHHTLHKRSALPWPGPT